MTQIKNIVLVHGAWADGSGWQGVYKILKHNGFNVSVVQNPLTTLADDVAAVDRALARLDGPAILVGHSYGGAVITEAGDDPKVAGLVYVAAFAPDVGESAFGLIPKDGPQPPLEPTADGYAYLNREAFLAAFAPDVDREQREFMADSQVVPSFAGGTAPLTVAAWKTKPSWYLIATADQIIPPDAQLQMARRAGATITEVKSSHVAYVTHPKPVAELIEQAAKTFGR
jgi:pimeloyl-ACP methyl ester carboxylesterase